MLVENFKKKKTFFDFFPVPSFLSMHHVGIDISENAIRFVELKRENGIAVLKKYGEEKLPFGTIKEGEIIDGKALISALQKIRGNFSTNFVRCTLPEEKVYMFTLDLPILEELDIRGAVEMKLEENVPISVKESVFDFSIISISSEKNSMSVSVAVYSKRVAESYVGVLHEAGLYPLSFHTQGQAIARSVVSSREKDANIILSFGQNSSLISIVKNRTVLFTTVVNIGGSSFTEAIQRYFGISRNEAIKMKTKKYLFGESKSNNELLLSLMNVLSAIKDELERVVAYWNVQVKEKDSVDKINKIIMCGSDSNLFGFGKYLYLTTNLENETANVWSNAFSLNCTIPEIGFQESLDYAGAIGMALPSNL